MLVCCEIYLIIVDDVVLIELRLLLYLINIYELNWCVGVWILVIIGVGNEILNVDIVL